MSRSLKRECAGEAWRLSGAAIREKLPYLSMAAGIAELKWDDGATGTDGVRIFLNADEVIGWFRRSAETLERRYLHLLLHGLYLHSFRKPLGRERLWWLACDILTEYRIDGMGVEGFERPIPDARGRWYRRLRAEKLPMEERSLALWLGGREEEELRTLEDAFREDDHSRWFSSRREEPGRGMELSMPAAELERCADALERWREAFERLELRKTEERRQSGGSIGAKTQAIVLEKERGHDYRQFLKLFAVEREELLPDMDSFDYIPYDYSRRLYKELVLLEPLEYRETRKLEEFVIAIDTSGSCSGEVVRRFLEETWAILNERENFFRDMRLHLIQCDCVIQEHKVITCEEEWREYLDHITVKGHGDTDFTPVFQLVDRLIKEREIQNLLGLLYFTDGDGVYPPEPDYTAAFVFLSQELKKGNPPAWALSLTLDQGKGEL